MDLFHLFHRKYELLVLYFKYSTEKNSVNFFKKSKQKYENGKCFFAWYFLIYLAKIHAWIKVKRGLKNCAICRNLLGRHRILFF